MNRLDPTRIQTTTGAIAHGLDRRSFVEPLSKTTHLASRESIRFRSNGFSGIARRSRFGRATIGLMLLLAIMTLSISISGCRSVSTTSRDDRSEKPKVETARQLRREIEKGFVNRGDSDTPRQDEVAGKTNVGKTSPARSSNAQVGLATSDDDDTFEPLSRTSSSTQIKQTNLEEEPSDSGTRSSVNFIEFLTFQNDVGTKRSDNSTDTSTSDSTNPTDPLKSPDAPKKLRLRFPDEIPGATAPDLEFPSLNERDQRAKKHANKAQFPLLKNPKGIIPPDRRMTLAEFEKLTLDNNPQIAQALHNITVSQGTAIQSSLYPNPIAGYEADTVGSTFTRNYQGIYLSQQIKVANKLGLQRSAANMELANAQLGYEKTKNEILHQVRTGYYNVLVAQESSRINEALVSFINQVFEIMVDRLNGGDQAPFELAQFRTLAKQAFAAFVQSQNRYVSAWKQLAATVGVPDLPFATLEGEVDRSVPNLDYDGILAYVLSIHPDLQAARNLLAQARYQLRFSKVVPIPDPTVAGVFQNDSTAPGFQRTSYNLNFSFPLPLFDRNQGNIRSAMGKVELTSRVFESATNQLTVQLSDAFERYQNGRIQSELYRTQILPDLARAYRGNYDGYFYATSDTVDFGAVIVAQQNLSAGVNSYIMWLTTQWAAMADIANLMQLSDWESLLNSPNGVPLNAESETNSSSSEGGEK